MEVVKIGNNELQIKVYEGQRVVTFKDIDRVHERETETAKYRFRDNKKHFIHGVDYFEITKKNVGANFATTYGFSNKAPKGILLTESGYLMIVKSFTDDLAWKVQRQLVNSYFKFKEVMETVQPNGNDLILSNAKFTEAIDSLETCAAVFQSMMNYSTINYKQQQDLLQAARKRVNNLLGGAHSEEYKANSRIYFKNLWQDFCKTFQCGSYKDLNPLYMADDVAKNWISEWEYTER